MYRLSIRQPVRFRISTIMTTTKISLRIMLIMINHSLMSSSLSFITSSASAHNICRTSRSNPSRYSHNTLVNQPDLEVVSLQLLNIPHTFLTKPWMTMSTIRTVWSTDHRSIISSIAKNWILTWVTQQLVLLQCLLFHHALLGLQITNAVLRNSGSRTVTWVTRVTRFRLMSKCRQILKDSFKSKENCLKKWCMETRTLSIAQTSAQNTTKESNPKQLGWAPQVPSNLMVTQGAPRSKISTSIILTLTSTWASRMRTCTIIRKFSLSSYTHHNKICIRIIYRSTTMVISLLTSLTSSSRSRKPTHVKTK